MAINPSALSALPATAPSPKPAAPAAPKPAAKNPAPNPSRMGGGIANLVARNVSQAKRMMAPVMAQADAESNAADAELDRSNAALTDSQNQAVFAAMQQQRLVQVHTASMIRKVLPIVAIFALVGGAADGVAGAMAAFAGGLAGLTKGANQQYARGYQAFKDATAQWLQGRRDAIQQYHDALNDKSRSIQDNIKAADVVAAAHNVPALIRAAQSQQNAAAHDATTLQGDYIRRQTALEQTQMRLQKTQGAVDQSNSAMAKPTDAQVNDMLGALGKKGRAARSPAARAEATRMVTLANIAAAQKGVPYAQAAKSVHDFFRGKGILQSGKSLEQLESLYGVAPKPTAAPQSAEDRLATGAGATADDLKTFEAGLDAAATNYIAGEQIPYLGSFGSHGAKTGAGPSRFTVMERAGQMMQAAGIPLSELPLLRANVKARTKALTTLQDRSSLIGAEVGALHMDVSKMLAAAHAVGLGRLPAWNTITLAARRQSGDTAVGAYEQAVLDVQADYGKVLTFSTSSGGTTDFAMKTAMDAMSRASSPEVLAASAGQLAMAAANVEKGLRSNIADVSAGLTMMGLTKPVPGADSAPAPASTAALPAGWSEPR